MTLPFRVSKAQVKKVKSPLPVPTICPNCGGPVALQNNSIVYRRQYGPWPWIYRCQDDVCDSYVGLHPKTDIPIGIIANKATRAARKEAKGVLMPMWTEQGMDRDAVYRWLAEKMGIKDPNHAHIGWFDIAQCKRVVQICNENQGRKAA